MSATVTTNTVFEAFIEADKAMKELPAVREELASIRSKYQEVLNRNDSLATVIEDHEDALTKLRDTLAQREAELASATFRESEIRTKHEALRSAMVDSLGLSIQQDFHGAVMDVAKSEPTPSDESKLSAEGSDGSRVSVQPSPTAPAQTSAGDETASANGADHSIDVGTTTPSVGQSDSDPTTMADPTTIDSPGIVTPAEQSSQHVSTPSVTAEPSVDTNANPQEAVDHMGEGASSTQEPEPSSAGVSIANEPKNATGDGKTDTSPALPFAGHLHTSKPTGMEWGYWIVNGGEPGPWMMDDTIRRLRESHAQWVGHGKASDLAA